MKYTIGSRGSGVSTQLMIESHNFGYPIICRSTSVAKAKSDMAKNLGFEKAKYVSITDMRGLKGNFLVDDNRYVMEYLIQQYIDKNIHIAGIGDTVD